MNESKEGWDSEDHKEFKECSKADIYNKLRWMRGMYSGVCSVANQRDREFFTLRTFVGEEKTDELLRPMRDKRYAKT